MAKLNNQRINEKKQRAKRRRQACIDINLREPRMSFRNGKGSKFCGLQRTMQDSNVDLVRLKGQLTLRNKKVKPSMPKMPWDE